MTWRGLTLAAAAIAAFAGADAMALPTATELVPAVELRIETSYVIGFPMPVSLTLTNRLADTTLLMVPTLGILQPLGGIAVELTPTGGGRAIRGAAEIGNLDQDPQVTTYLPGQARRVVIDLSELGMRLQPGTYQISVAVSAGSSAANWSLSHSVTVLAPTDVERATAEHLLHSAAGLRAIPHWRDFMSGEGPTPPLPTGLRPAAVQQLRLHFFLHEAFHHPGPLAAVPRDPLRAFAGDILGPEAAALEYELLEAAADRTAAAHLRASVQATWPDLTYRLDEADDGSGLLAIGKHAYGPTP